MVVRSEPKMCTKGNRLTSYISCQPIRLKDHVLQSSKIFLSFSLHIERHEYFLFRHLEIIIAGDESKTTIYPESIRIDLQTHWLALVNIYIYFEIILFNFIFSSFVGNHGFMVLLEKLYVQINLHFKHVLIYQESKLISALINKPDE